MGVVTRLNHQMRHRRGIVGRGSRRQRQCHRDRLTRFHQTRRSLTFGVAYVVQRPALIILAPSAPVADAIEYALDFLLSQPLVVAHRHSPRAGFRTIYCGPAEYARAGANLTAGREPDPGVIT